MHLEPITDDIWGKIIVNLQNDICTSSCSSNEEKRQREVAEDDDGE
jgi:hypothetical protein